jgi:uncharacterized protein GlcG (DUF336 family)
MWPAIIHADGRQERAMIRSYVLAATAALVGFSMTVPVAAQDLPSETHKLLPAALAVEAAQTAIATCKGQGYNVAAIVTNRDGTPMVLIVGDGSGKLSPEIARRKAYTSASLRVSTMDFNKRVAGGGFNPSVFDPQLVTAAGGLPIKVGNDTIAAIGVSGAPGGDKDEACAQSGLDKIKASLQ